MAANDYTIGKGQADVWLANYQMKAMADEAMAIAYATKRAQHDVANATVEVVRVRKTAAPGRYTVTVRRVRTPQQDASEATTAPAATKAPKGRKENSDMASKAPKTAPEAPAPEAPYVIPAPGTARITEQLQLALQAQGLRRCAGMPKIGHPQHDAPIDNFNLNSARLLGRARLCKDARKAYNAVLSETAKANAPAKAPKAPKAKAPKPEPIKTAKPRAAKAPKPTAAPAPEATTAPAPDDVAEVQPSAGTKAAAAAAARAQVRRQAKEAAAAAAAKRAARRAPAPTADVEPEAEAVVAAADGAADDLPF